MSALRFGSACNAAVLLVAKYPGAMALTLMPVEAHSLASRRVSPAIPLLLAVYEGTRMPPWKDSMDAMLMILPPPLGIMWRAAACDRKNTDFRFTSSTASQSASVKSMALARRMMPALLTRTWSAPSLLTVSETMRALSGLLPRSAFTQTARRPRD